MEIEEIWSVERKIPRQPLTKDKYWFQYLVAFSATLLSLSSAISLGWTSPTIPKLLSKDSHIPITSDMGSWIVALLSLGMISSPICAAWTVDKFGRKGTLLMSALPLVVGWILVGIAESVVLLYISRILSGITCGLTVAVLPMYLAEIASDNIRGSLSTLLIVMVKFGVLYVYSIGPFVSVKMMAWLALIPPIIFLATFIWLPESPYYLLGKGQHERARKCLLRLRRHNDIDDELKRISTAVEASQETKGTFWQLFVDKGNRKALIIILGLGTAQQLCGFNVIIAYSQMIFERVSSKLESSKVSIILGVVQLLTACVSSSVVDVVGRRLLLLTSVTGTSICNTVVGLYFFLERMEVDVSDFAWLPMLVIMVFITTYTIGMAPVPYVLLGEIFPKNLKAVAAAVFAINASAFNFFVIKLFPVVSEVLGSDVTFWGFAACTYLFIPFVWFLVPETKRKSLDVILDEIRNRRSRSEPVS